MYYYVLLVRNKYDVLPLQSYWSLYCLCDHGLLRNRFLATSSCENDNPKNNNMKQAALIGNITVGRGLFEQHRTEMYYFAYTSKCIYI